MILRLHYAPDNASLCVRLALEELGLPYDTILVDRSTRAQKSPAYLALNPNGLIPVLETPQGPLYETGAILLWLADTHGRLMPDPQDPQRGDALKWLFWLSNTLHASLRMTFYPSQYTGGGQVAEQALLAQTKLRLNAQLTILNAAKDAGWLDAKAPTAMACYLAPLLRWSINYTDPTGWFDLALWPRLHHFALRFETRPAIRRATDAEGFGPTPFSAPQPFVPPQGSPT